MQSSQVKVVLMGDSGVGKSSIVLRFVADNFKQDEDPTIGAAYMSKMIQISDKPIKFNIWDTAGQERYQSLAKMYYRDANAAILVYDITRSSSFEGLERWYNELRDNGPKGITIAIAGNKEDLVEREEVDADHAKRFAESIGAIYVKTSAKTNFGLETLFNQIATRLYPNLGENKPKGGKQLEKPSSSGKSQKGCC